MHPLANYLHELRDIRLSGGGVKETSYYAALAGLFNEAGKGLTPKVRCILNLRDTGAGLPDGGFFAHHQFPGTSAEAPEEGQIPERGALEVKGLDEEVFAVAESEQVSRYLKRYGQVLVTNLRDFVLVGVDHSGERKILESFRIAPTKENFLIALNDPTKIAEEQGDLLLGYLERILLRPVPLADPKDLAWFLASYAKDARKRLEGVTLPALDTLRESLEASLGIRFKDEQGEHFFRSTLVQTLFYGVFSAWVLWNRQDSKERFHWREAAWYLRVPMIRALFHQVADPARLERLGLVEVLDWAEESLARVERETFFTRFREEQAVLYFYEPFLEAFDPMLRKQLGVWYTPPEIVRYMVAKVDHVLRTELDIPDGLADPRVVVLDPCCGTGAYLVEVLHRIEETLRRKGDDALIASDVKTAAMQRVFGFDIMPAPFVVAHLQLGLLLQQMGASFGEDERAGIYLTNSLTGWIPPEDPKEQLAIALPELEEEREQAVHVKRQAPVIVILGNPPYDSYPGVAVGEERDLTEAYGETRRGLQPAGRGRNDLFARFFRMAERKITEMKPYTGVVCFISNYSWLGALSYPGMRETFMERFGRIWVDCLNGDKYDTGKRTPEGDPDPSVFSTTLNPEGIQLGTAIATLVRRDPHTSTETVFFRNLWGKTKLRQLEEDTGRLAEVSYDVLEPNPELGYPFAPRVLGDQYLEWPRLTELFPFSQPGIFTARDDFLVDIDRDALLARMHEYFDPALSHEQVAARYPTALKGTARFDGPKVRRYLLSRGIEDERLVRYLYRPFDVRWLYWERETKLLDEKRPDYHQHVAPSNLWIAAVRHNRKKFDPPPVAVLPASLHLIERGANLFPLKLMNNGPPQDLWASRRGEDPRCVAGGEYCYNLSDDAVDYLEEIGSIADAPHLFHHAIAMLHAPLYRKEHAGALRQDWPRIPLPRAREPLLRSAEHGRRLAALLVSEAEVEGVTVGAIRPELLVLGPVQKKGRGQLNPDAGDLAVTARWGYAGNRGATMPGRGRTEERAYTDDERAALEKGAAELGFSAEALLDLLGPTTLDVYLNEEAYWRCIPSRVWDYSLGGYQVLKKWLSYRDYDLLNRPLTVEEVRAVTTVTRRIAAVLLLEPRLDATYEAISRPP